MLEVVVITVGPLMTLAEAKQHLRVDSDDDDALIEAYADAAVQRCLTYCDLKLVPVGAEPSFKAAALLFLGDLYGFREPALAGSVTLSQTVTALIDPYRIIRV